MRTNHRAAFGLLFLLLSGLACQPILRKMAGVSKPKKISREELQAKVDQMKWPRQEVMYMSPEGWHQYFQREGYLPQVFVFREDGWLSFKRGGKNCDKSFMEFVPKIKAGALPLHSDSMQLPEWWQNWRSLETGAPAPQPQGIVMVSFWADFVRPVSVWTERVDSIRKADGLNLWFFRINADPIGWKPK